MFKSESKTCCLITGASRGFGRSVAVALARQFSDSGTKGRFILISRSGDDLEEARNRIIQVCATAEGIKAQDIRKIVILRVIPLETSAFPLCNPSGNPQGIGHFEF